MKNTFVILLYKLFEMKIFLEEFYENLFLSDTVNNNFALKNTASILASEEKKQLEFYRQCVKKSELGENYIIEDDVMSQIEFYLINLKQTAGSYGIGTAGQLIAKAIDNQNKLLFLITRIKELLKPDTDSLMGNILNALLLEEQKHLNNLLPFRKLN